MIMLIKEHYQINYEIPQEVLGGTCIDVGANVGSFLLAYGHLFSKVHFYEPLLPCFKICLERCKDKPHLTGFNEAAYQTSDEIMEMVLHFNRSSGSAGLRTDSLNADWGNEVVARPKTCNLARMIERIGGPVDYLKCDCETSEYYFLMNQDLLPIQFIMIELHWQMGENKYTELLNHIALTHMPTSSTISWTLNQNKSVLFKKRTETGIS